MQTVTIIAPSNRVQMQPPIRNLLHRGHQLPSRVKASELAGQAECSGPSFRMMVCS
jgi:hypothetical protein